MVVVMSGVLLVYLFQENKSRGSENHLHSSSGVQESRVGHKQDVRHVYYPNKMVVVASQGSRVNAVAGSTGGEGSPLQPLKQQHVSCSVCQQVCQSWTDE
jgi:hypothetical protein